MALGWLWWRARVPVDAVAAAAVCVAGVVLGDIERRFCVAGAALGDRRTFCVAGGTWRHRACILRGRRGTYDYGTGLALVARLGPS